MEMQKESANEVIERIEKKRLESARLGKRQVRLLAIIGIFSVALGLPFAFRNTLSIACTLFETVAVATVCIGVKKIRYVYAIAFGALSINVIHPLLVSVFDYKPSLTTLGIALILAFRLIYLVWFSAVLFISKNISEYLYEINSK